MKLTKAQLQSLHMAKKRDWPAGEPKVSWFNKPTYAVLVRLGLVEELFPSIVHLTEAGRKALEESK